MCPQDDFDPKDVLKGWSAAKPRDAGVPEIDLGRVFGGGKSAAPNLDLGRVLDAVAQADGLKPRADMTRVLDEWSTQADGSPATRRRKMTDVVDVEPVFNGAGPEVLDPAVDLADIGQGARQAVKSDARRAATAVDDVDYVETARAVRRYLNPRLVPEWRHDAWIGVIRQVGDATTEFVQSSRGPVVEAHAPQVLLALWPPQGHKPVPPDRWPPMAALAEAEPDRAADALVALLPEGALAWLSPAEPDWALIAEIVLHHDESLRPFQMTALRQFIEAERGASFARLNDDYAAPGPGSVVRRRD